MAASFKQLVTNLLKARFPIMYVQSWEEERVIGDICEVGASMKTPRKIVVWSCTNGFSGEGIPAKDETKTPMKALDAIEKDDFSAIYVLRDFHVYFANSPSKQESVQIIRRLRDLVPILKSSNRRKNIVIVAPTLALPVELQKDITVVDFSLPGYEEILALLNEMIESNRSTGKIEINLDEKGAGQLAKAAQGLTLQEAENAFARAMVEDGKLDVSDVEVILDEKRQIIKKTQILEFITSDLKMADVGGLENLKRWLARRNKSWQDEAKAYCLPPPKGVLITGVPGCGKSLVSKAISATWQLPLLRLDMGRIFGGLVGQSEENIRTAIRTAEAIAPSILWIDEIEKGFSGASGGGGDSGTSTRVFGTFLTWMQEKTEPVFVIATANNISSLPSEMLRKGRFDEIFFVDLPTRNERVAIFKLHIEKRLKNKKVIGSFKASEENLGHLAEMTEGFVGAEIEAVVISALFEAFSEDRAITLADFEKAINNTVPLSVTQAEQIHAIRRWANERAVAATAKDEMSQYQANNQNEQDAPQDVRETRGGRMVDF